MTPDRNAPGVYVPDNPAVDDVLRKAGGRGFRLDHARLLLHFICAKRWLGDVDKDAFARLNAGILREWIHPKAFGPLKRHLVDSGVLITAPHSAGRFATGFRIAEAFDGPPRRCTIDYVPLARKLSAWRTAHKEVGNDRQLQAVIAWRRPLLDHFRGSLESLSLPAAPDAVVNALRDDVDANHVAYVTQCIQHHDYDGMSVDGFGYRVHHLITRTSSHLRPFLLLDKRPVVEVDIANCQPLFLAMLLSRAPCGNNAQHMEGAHTIMEENPPRDSCPPDLDSGILGILLGIKPHPPEAKAFLRICQAGGLYDLLADDLGIERHQAKRQLFRDVLFGRSHIKGPLTDAFRRRWPALLEVIRQAKRRCGYKIIAQALQRLESFLVLDRICPRLLQEFSAVPFVTIHDSVMVPAGAAERVKGIMLEEFARWGVTPTIRIKGKRL